MNRKRVYSGIFIILMISILLISSNVVSAQAQGTRGGGNSSFKAALDKVINWIGDQINKITSTDKNLIAQGLLFILLFIFIWIVITRIPAFEGRFIVVFILSLVVSLLAVRAFANQDWLETIITPYSVLGVAFASLLPLIIYFYFVITVIPVKPKFFRIGAWVFAICIYAGLFFKRYDELGDVAYVYLITAIIVLVLALLDKRITHMLNKMKAKEEMKSGDYLLYLRERKQANKLKHALINLKNPKDRKELETKIEGHIKKMAELLDSTGIKPENIADEIVGNEDVTGAE